MYGSIPGQHSEASKASTLAAACGIAALVVVAAVGFTAQPSLLYAGTAVRPATQIVTPILGSRNVVRAVEPVFAAQAEYETASPMRSAPVTQASSWTSLVTFAAGCAFAVAGLAMHRRAAAPAPALSPSVECDLLAMFALGGVKELHVVPPVIGKDPESSMRRRMEAMLRKGQDHVCAAIEKSDGKGKFHADAWMREDGGGGGISKVMADGAVWEKAGVNLSVVWGSMPQAALAAATEQAPDHIKKMNLKPDEKVPFFVAGLSCVMHPRNPFCPTMHFNYRMFEINGNIRWFAGGTDITPAYLDEDDMKHFHGTYKKICDKYDPYFYEEFKKWADEYFLIKHREETRGLGGIFFDDLNDRDEETLFKFCEECLMAVPEAYVPIIEKHKHDSFTPEQKRWQLIRRGRYTEFNLVYDRGTIFGLKAGGRIESILMTLPENACWEYDHHPAAGSEEERITKAFQHPRSWV